MTNLDGSNLNALCVAQRVNRRDGIYNLRTRISDDSIQRQRRGIGLDKLDPFIDIYIETVPVNGEVLGILIDGGV